jgi:hypothetical protein
MSRPVRKKKIVLVSPAWSSHPHLGCRARKIYFLLVHEVLERGLSSQMPNIQEAHKQVKPQSLRLVYHGRSGLWPTPLLQTNSNCPPGTCNQRAPPPSANNLNMFATKIRYLIEPRNEHEEKLPAAPFLNTRSWPDLNLRPPTSPPIHFT